MNLSINKLEGDLGQRPAGIEVGLLFDFNILLKYILQKL